MKMIKALISNGHFKFILATAAAETYKRGALEVFITGAYPKGLIRKIIASSLFNTSVYAGRLSARHEPIRDDLVKSDWVSEILVQLALFLQNKGWVKCVSTALYRLGFWVYSRGATRVVSASSANIYHYRSGYGLKSVELAKKKGMIAICDHSIAHPSTVQYLIENKGQIPEKSSLDNLGSIWQDIKNDIDQADHIFVNSNFVKQTFLSQGWAPDSISVIYSGIDDEFLGFINNVNEDRNNLPIKFMFAGDFNERKGCDILVGAFNQILSLPWSLEVIGNIDPIYEKKYRSFFKSNKVSHTAFLSRSILAKRMAAADIFVFPSLAEGSARVIFMAMASGCYVITTPNSGSVVQDGINGLIVEPGSVDQLACALRETILMDRKIIKNIGERNSIYIKNNYSQKNYGSALFQGYIKVMSMNVNKTTYKKCLN